MHVRRILPQHLVAFAAVGLMLVCGASAVAKPVTHHRAGPVTGKVVSSTTGAPLAGLTVRLRVSTPGGGAGAVVDTDTTASNGTFALSAGGTGRYLVQLVAGTYQGGYAGRAGGDWTWFQVGTTLADEYGPHAAIGKIRANPAFITGVVVSSATKRPVRGVKVTARSDTDASQYEGMDVTDANGRFYVKGIECEDDCYLKLNGADVGYETGFLASTFAVVATFDDAIASPLGQIGHQIRLDHL